MVHYSRSALFTAVTKVFSLRSPPNIVLLKGLEGFGYIQVIWWFSGCDDTHSKSRLTKKVPLKKVDDNSAGEYEGYP